MRGRVAFLEIPTDSIESQGTASIEMWYETNEMGSTVIWGGYCGVAAARGGLGGLMKVPRLRAAAAVADVVIG